MRVTRWLDSATVGLPLAVLSLLNVSIVSAAALDQSSSQDFSSEEPRSLLPVAIVGIAIGAAVFLVLVTSCAVGYIACRTVVFRKSVKAPKAQESHGIQMREINNSTGQRTFNFVEFHLIWTKGNLQVEELLDTHPLCIIAANGVFYFNGQGFIGTPNISGVELRSRLGIRDDAMDDATGKVDLKLSYEQLLEVISVTGYIPDEMKPSGFLRLSNSKDLNTEVYSIRELIKYYRENQGQGQYFNVLSTLAGEYVAASIPIDKRICYDVYYYAIPELEKIGKIGKFPALIRCEEKTYISSGGLRFFDVTEVVPPTINQLFQNAGPGPAAAVGRTYENPGILRVSNPADREKLKEVYPVFWAKGIKGIHAENIVAYAGMANYSVRIFIWNSKDRDKALCGLTTTGTHIAMVMKQSSGQYLHVGLVIEDKDAKLTGGYVYPLEEGRLLPCDGNIFGTASYVVDVGPFTQADMAKMFAEFVSRSRSLHYSLIGGPIWNSVSDWVHSKWPNISWRRYENCTSIVTGILEVGNYRRILPTQLKTTTKGIFGLTWLSFGKYMFESLITFGTSFLTINYFNNANPNTKQSIFDSLIITASRLAVPSILSLLKTGFYKCFVSEALTFVPVNFGDLLLEAVKYKYKGNMHVVVFANNQDWQEWCRKHVTEGELPCLILVKEGTDAQIKYYVYGLKDNGIFAFTKLDHPELSTLSKDPANIQSCSGCKVPKLIRAKDVRMEKVSEAITIARNEIAKVGAHVFPKICLSDTDSTVMHRAVPLIPALCVSRKALHERGLTPHARKVPTEVYEVAQP